VTSEQQTGIRPQWEPTAADVEQARITDFARWVERRTGRALPDYPALWQWSIDDLDGFWRSIRDYFDVPSTEPSAPALATETMPGAVWFPGVRLNYVDQVARSARADRPAIVYESEGEVFRPACRLREVRHAIHAFFHCLRMMKLFLFQNSAGCR